jgi:hypothetical protein
MPPRQDRSTAGIFRATSSPVSAKQTGSSFSPLCAGPAERAV